jgi:hypothetical protein
MNNPNAPHEPPFLFCVSLNFLPLQLRSVVGLGLLGIFAIVRPSSAQMVLSPSPHFGAARYPDPEPVGFVGAHFDRFTRFGKETDNQGQYLYEPYNDINETVGLNFLALSTSQRVPSFRGTLLRLVFQAGIGHNQPTKWVQNEIHDSSDPPLLHVPDSATRKAFDLGIGADLTRWFRIGNVHALPVFVGAGASVSTVYQEAFWHAGLRPRPWKWGEITLPTPSAMVRAGLTLGGDAFPTRTLERGYLAGQASVLFPFHNWVTKGLGDVPVIGLAVQLIPDIEALLSWESGFFSAHDGSALPEKFIAFHVSFFNGLFLFEYWNDTINNKDQGPTGGGRLYIRTKALPLLDRLP